jgi:hypothetical protein
MAPGAQPPRPPVGSVARLPIGVAFLFLSPLSQAIQEEQGMVDDLAIAGTKLDGSYRAVFLDGDRNDEATEHIPASGGHREGFRHLEDEVRGAELPALGKHRHLRQVPGVALGRSRIRPGGERFDVLVTQSPGVMEFTKARLGVPGWHPPTAGDVLEELRSFGSVLIRQQRERPNLTWTMTVGTVLPQNGSYILIEGDGFCFY